jgi:hypothetical protein
LGKGVSKVYWLSEFGQKDRSREFYHGKLLSDPLFQFSSRTRPPLSDLLLHCSSCSFSWRWKKGNESGSGCVALRYFLLLVIARGIFVIFILLSDDRERSGSCWFRTLQVGLLFLKKPNNKNWPDNSQIYGPTKSTGQPKTKKYKDKKDDVSWLRHSLCLSRLSVKDSPSEIHIWKHLPT